VLASSSPTLSTLDSSAVVTEATAQEPLAWDGSVAFDWDASTETTFSLLGGLDPFWQNSDSAQDAAFWASFIDGYSMETSAT
jgi:hypothetical protein